MFGGFLWIGAGRLAVASLVIVGAGLVFFVYDGFPLLPNSAWLATYSSLAFNLLSVAVVLPFRTRFKADKWYSHGLWVIAFNFLLAWLLAFLIRGFLFQPFSIPSRSMEPTLLPGDYLFVSKFAYGYGPYSLPFSILPAEGRLFGAPPERGDIVVFKLPSETNVDYIQRVGGLPGDRIQMVGGTLHINGEPVKNELLGPYSNEGTADAQLQRETLPNGVTYEVLDLNPNTIADDTALFEVPDGHYFMLGDNRDNSTDSRFAVGMVPYENFVGKAVRLFWNANGTEYKSRQALD
jgi:signal peptidase I